MVIMLAFLAGIIIGCVVFLILLWVKRSTVDDGAFGLDEAVITVAAAVIIVLAVLQQFNIFQADSKFLNYEFYVPTFLAVLGVAVLYQFKKLQDNFKKLEPISEVTGICPISRFPHSHDGFRRLTALIHGATTSIDQIAIAETPELPDSVLKKYLEVMREQATSSVLKYRWLCGDNFPERTKRLEQLASEGQRVFIRQFSDAATRIPALNFAVFDSEIVFVRYPNDPAGKEVYVELRSPEVAELFQEYFETLWNSAERQIK